METKVKSTAHRSVMAIFLFFTGVLSFGMGEQFGQGWGYIVFGSVPLFLCLLVVMQMAFRALTAKDVRKEMSMEMMQSGVWAVKCNCGSGSKISTNHKNDCPVYRINAKWVMGKPTELDPPSMRLAN